MNYKTVKKDVHNKIKKLIDEYIDEGAKVSHLKKYFKNNQAVTNLIRDIHYEGRDQFEDKHTYRDFINTTLNNILKDYKAYYKDKPVKENKIIKNFFHFLNESNNKKYFLNNYKKGVELVPIRQIEKFAEFDREKQNKWGKKDNSIDVLEEEIKQEGIRTPIQLEIGYESGNYYGLITEGNTRIAVAKRLGLEYIPVRVVKRSRKWEGTIYNDRKKEIDVGSMEHNMWKVKNRYNEPMFDTPLAYGFDSILPEDL